MVRQEDLHLYYQMMRERNDLDDSILTVIMH